MAIGDSINEPGARVTLPAGLKPPFNVYVNGIEQTEGKDYRVSGKHLFFREILVREGRLGFWRWSMMFLGVANTYRHNDGVDVICRVKGRPHAFTALPIETLGDPQNDGQRTGAVSFDPSAR